MQPELRTTCGESFSEVVYSSASLEALLIVTSFLIVVSLVLPKIEKRVFQASNSAYHGSPDHWQHSRVRRVCDLCITLHHAKSRKSLLRALQYLPGHRVDSHKTKLQSHLDPHRNCIGNRHLALREKHLTKWDFSPAEVSRYYS